MPVRSILAGVGGYLPERVVSNDELARTSIRPTNGFANAPAFGSGISPVHTRPQRSWALLPRDALRTPVPSRATSTPSFWRPVHRSGVSLHGDTRDGGTWRAQRFGFDLSAACAGFIYALSVRTA